MFVYKYDVAFKTLLTVISDNAQNSVLDLGCGNRVEVIRVHQLRTAVQAVGTETERYQYVHCTTERLLI